MVINDVMSTSVCCIDADTALSATVIMMGQKSISCVLITENDKLEGIFTERDIVRHYSKAIQTNAFTDPPITEVMTASPFFVHDDLDLADALALTESRKLRHLPVVDHNGTVIGIVTQSDIANASIRLMSDRGLLEDEIEKFRSMSLEDALLGIANRRGMEMDLEQAEAWSTRHGRTYCICLIDIDYFKSYNDHYGHQAGDAALQAVGEALKISKRNSDRLYRYGGEELLVLMPETDLEGAKIGAERLRAQIEEIAYTHEKSPFGFLTASAGLAQSVNGAWQDVVKAADEALYSAKSGGRNQVQVFEV